MRHCSDSGGQYRDGTIDTTRTMHFGHPTKEQCEAYTRVLQGHVRCSLSPFHKATY
jgi:Xaa-Pro aminopeptidase